MASAQWDEIIRELRSARLGLLESPVHGLAGVEETLEKVRRDWDGGVLPSAAQAQEVRQLLSEIRALIDHGEELVNGWRAALGSLADVYDVAGAPVNGMFASTQISARG